MEKIGEINFSGNPADTFNMVVLDVIYTFKTQLNTLGFWTVTVSDEDGVVIVAGVKILAVSYIFEPYPSLPFDFYVAGLEDPARDNLNTFVIEVWSK